MRFDILSLAAIIAGVITLWQPRHFRLAVGVYLLLVGVLGLGVVHV